MNKPIEHIAIVHGFTTETQHSEFHLPWEINHYLQSILDVVCHIHNRQIQLQQIIFFILQNKNTKRLISIARLNMLLQAFFIP